MRWWPALILAVKVSSVTVSGLVFGISNTAVTPPITALREPVSRSSLCVESRLAEMHLRVHHAGQDVQALAVDRLAGGSLSEPADRGDPAIGNADVADALAVLIDHGAGFQNGIKSLIHRCFTVLERPL